MKGLFIFYVTTLFCYLYIYILVLTQLLYFSNCAGRSYSYAACRHQGSADDHARTGAQHERDHLHVHELPVPRFNVRVLACLEKLSYMCSYMLQYAYVLKTPLYTRVHKSSPRIPSTKTAISYVHALILIFSKPRFTRTRPCSQIITKGTIDRYLLCT